MPGRTISTRSLILGMGPVLLASVLAACGSSGGGSGATSAAASASGPGGQPAGTVVVATETEYKIKLSRTSFPPGTYTFVAKDAGSATHALEIAGPGVDAKSTANINHGQSASLSVTLGTGSYEIWCPVDGHKQLGMDTHITVR